MTFNHFFRVLTQRPYLIAIFIVLVLILWMASGANSQEQNTSTSTKQPNEIIAKVKAEHFVAQNIHETIELYGRTEPNRITRLKAEVRGKITEVHAKRGSTVTKGQVIAKIALNDLPAQLTRSQALLTQREVEYEGALKLSEQGYQGKVQLAQAFAELTSVKADIQRLEMDIENTVIKAPFTGILTTRYVEEGDYVASGDDVALIADLDPLIVRAHVTESQISQLALGQVAQVSLLGGDKTTGKLRYLASVGDDATNTFKIEVEIDNEEALLLAGLSSELQIELTQQLAIKVSPALLALDEQGNIGIKSIKQKQVVFTPINIIKSDKDGIWLTGLGEKADLITLGQGFVRAGDEVDAVYDSEPSKKPASDKAQD